MNKANECTCPSGDGSLVHPCPAHPAVEQADVAAKLTFINGRPAMCGCQVEYSDGGGEYSDVIYVTLCAKHSGSAILDLVATNRIALTPEYEGQWHADLYLDREIPLAKVEGATPAEAVLALMSAERIDPEQESVEQAGGDERAAFKTAYLAEFDCDADGDDNMAHSNTAWRAWKMARAALAQPSPAGEYGDAYQGAREDIAIWKRRALEAEQALRQAHNGQTFMGEPLVQPYEAPREKVNALFKVLGFSGTASVGDILDAALERLQAQPSPALPPFAEKVLAKLRRFYDCASDFESGGVDIGRHWLDLLTQLGLLNRVQRSPALWEISQQGEDLLGMPQPSPAQAEAERPEVAAWQYRVTAGPQTGWSLWHPGKGEEFERSYTVERRPLMTVAQHERIVGELRAENAKLSEALDRWPLIRDSLKLRLADALARVAELELKLDKSDYAYDNDRIHMRGLAARAIARAKVFDDGSDGADAESARSVVAILRELLAVGPAQAQHSVPEGYALIPVRETEAMHDAVMALLYKGVARTDTQKLLDAYIAAAPGKEGV
ncbi:hypothetical protein [Pseudomonas aeruginosa]|uniref:hypothetical protein n=1 Tax=Pseudomonas aeruginosa TaxID=287 RepID=UPI000B328539|nr:hypothetical protein [Pseudomonas aeruginosa]